MDRERLKEILERLKKGEIGVEEALKLLKGFPFEDIGFAKLDTHRAIRKGFPEVVFCQGKTPAQVKKIVERLGSKNEVLLLTRASEPVFKAVKTIREDAVYHRVARLVVVGQSHILSKEEPPGKEVLVLTAGTSDIPVAEEAAITCEVMRNKVVRLYDVGVAGLHRLFYYMDYLEKAGVIIVVAGMEGALASIVGGVVDKPVIAVPTSIGYGASFHGLSALLTMLNSCAPGVAVVNIDNGFGAGYFASLINRGWRT